MPGLRRSSSSTVVEYVAAMLPSVSPLSTVWYCAAAVVVAAVETGGGVTVTFVVGAVVVVWVVGSAPTVGVDS